jgi:hypothetical protein
LPRIACHERRFSPAQVPRLHQSRPRRPRPPDDDKRARKASRGDPRKKQGHANGAPEVRRVTRDQIETARQLKDNHASS